jgi:hypothetical protein
MVTMAFAQQSYVGTRVWVLSVSLASGLGVAALGGSVSGEAAGLAVPTIAARSAIVLAQTSPAPDKKAESQKAKKTKRRAIRCGGPGLPECPM